MQITTSTARPVAETFLSNFFGSPSPWSRTTYAALLGLVALWAVQVYATWAAWGNLTIDSGHEMYVPALLAEGKTLYRDMWFMYGPVSPYLSSYLFRLFGIHLNVLYWAGSLSALGSALLIYLAGMRLSSWLAGWTAGAVILLDGFQPSLFCFPLPYSFAAVYGCLIGCLFLFLAIRASNSSHWWWMFSAGTLAGVELLTKPEFGMACYATLLLLMAVRSLQQRSATSILKDVAATLPGIAICAVVIRWMVSIAGVEFITQENILSWPTSHFMTTYGKMWLQKNGFTLAPEAFGAALWRALPLAGVYLAIYCLLWWKATGRRATLLRILQVSMVTLYCGIRILLSPASLKQILAQIFFPQDMVLYVAIATLVIWWVWRDYRRKSNSEISPAFPILLTYSGLLAFRILMNMFPAEYPIYYNGPVVLSFLLLARLVFMEAGRSRRFIFLGELVICLGCLGVVAQQALKAESHARHYVPLVTERGTVRVSRPLKESYEIAIRFMKEKASRGQSVLSVPEDTSLYFLSGTYCPTRIYSFSPGSIAPGKMTQEVIQEIDRKHVDYLLWSNRTFSEFGVPIFGINFDRPLGDYLKSHYRPVGRLAPPPIHYWDWSAIVWERKPPGESN